MAKGETKKTNKMLDVEHAKQQQQFDPFIAGQGKRSEEAYGRSLTSYDALMRGYSDLAAGNTLAGAGGSFGGGGYSLPSTYGEVAGSYRDFMKGGGVDVGAMRAGHGTLAELAGTGGYDAATRERLMGDIGRYRQFAETGGVDEASRARMRGAGVFDEFARTGGVSPAEAANLRSRATSTIPAYYQSMQDEMNRRGRIGGGSPAMGNAMALKMARERSRGSADAALSAELGISDMTRQGRMWGAQGAAESERGLQGLVTSNQLAGIGGAAGTEMGMANAIAGNRLGAASNLGASEQNIQGLVQRGRMFGTSGLEGVAGAEAAAAASSGAASASDARFREGLRSEGLQGLLALRGQEPGEVGAYDRNQLQALMGRGGLSNDLIGQRYGAPGNQGTDWAKWAGVAAGIGGAAFTGGASLSLTAAALAKKKKIPQGYDGPMG